MSFLLPTVQYAKIKINELNIIEKDGVPYQVKIEGQNFKITKRFLDSLCSRFGLSTSEFNHFSYNEVFERISKTNSQPQIQVTIQLTRAADELSGAKFNLFGKEQYGPEFEPKLLGVSNPEKTNLDLNDFAWVMQRAKPGWGYPESGSDIQYRDGVLLTRHIPSAEMKFCVGGDNDQLESRFVLETPIDGYGKPTIWLGFILKNGMNSMVVYHKNFQSMINTGTDENQRETLLRLIQSFNNEDGFADLKKRILTAQNSWSSIYEVVSLNKIIWSLNFNDFIVGWLDKNYKEEVGIEQIKTDILLRIQKLTGDLRAIFGIAQLDSLSEKKQHSLPTKASVYQLLSLASEYATHALFTNAARKLQQYIGDILSKDFDLENSCDQFKRFEQFLTKGEEYGIN